MSVRLLLLLEKAYRETQRRCRGQYCPFSGTGIEKYRTTVDHSVHRK